MCNSEKKANAKSSTLFQISSHIPDSHPRLLQGTLRWNTFPRETRKLEKKIHKDLAVGNGSQYPEAS